MQLITPKYFKFKYIINFLIVLLPLSFIAGNLAINLNVILIIILSLIFFKKEFFTLKLFFFDKLLIFLFLFILFSGILNNFYAISPIENENVSKTLFFFRYLLFYFSIKLIVERKIFNFKLFFISASMSVLFVSLDIMLQLISGKDLFGYPKTQYKLSGPFGDEQIAGSYLQRFSIFLFFLIPTYMMSKNKNYLILILSAFFILIFFSMLIAGNRMPIILFLIMLSSLFLFEKKLIKFSLFFISFFSILFLITFYLSPQVQDYSQHFLRTLKQIIIFSYEVFLRGESPNITNTYLIELYSGYTTWKENILFGGGINSFYLNCVKTIEFCSSHPHNYYLEILSELGVVGFLLIMIMLIKLFHLSIINKNELSLDFNKNLITPFTLLLLVEVFPLKTSGSFFSTGNASFIFFIIAIIVGLSTKSESH